MSLTGEVIIVTGASRGIGEAAARDLAKQGAAVVLIARTKQAIGDIAKHIEAEGGAALSVAADVTNYQAVETAVAASKEKFGKVTGLVNSAGAIEPIAPLAKTKPRDWAELIHINLVGSYNTIRAVLPHFTAQNDGVIINLSSGAAFRPLEGWSAYCSSKAGLAMLSQATTLEVQDTNIRVYGFSPGVVDTQMQGQIRASGINPVSQIPRETLSAPQDAAKAISYLCSAAARDLKGQELDIRNADLRQRIGLAAF